MSLVADFPDYGQHVATAAQIAGTGAPPLTLSNGVSNNVYSVAGGGGVNINTFTFNQPAYEVFFNIFQQSAPTVAGPVRVRMLWYEDNGVSLVDQQFWYFWPSTGSLGHIVTGRGPSRAGLLGMVVDNFSTGGTYVIHLWLYQRSHFYTRDDWRTLSMTNTLSGLTLPTNDPTADLLGYRSLSVGIGATDTTLLPLFNGPVLLYADTASNTTDMTLTLNDSANPNGEGSGVFFYRLQSGSTGLITAQLALPRYQCSLSMTNGNAAAKNLKYALHAIEF